MALARCEAKHFKIGVLLGRFSSVLGPWKGASTRRLLGARSVLLVRGARDIMLVRIRDTHRYCFVGPSSLTNHNLIIIFLSISRCQSIKLLLISTLSSTKIETDRFSFSSTALPISRRLNKPMGLKVPSCHPNLHIGAPNFVKRV
jgi:hypothetical protein